ncbi:GNAT family N-acetyltransferase [Larkinella soli]|uniref:GNAT family N-acetyltransferase n=1 Tax=Larkinella soli TaxID=1770527 RepID=UPI000FFC47A9|nr:GNAT family N-acetyltransferase [Larkinella soli]
MSERYSLSFLLRHEIDEIRYDRCIARSPQRLIYAFSWYLDAVSPGWEALILGDYEWVMPLPVRRRFGVRAVLQPLFCHQLGVFGDGKTPDAGIIRRSTEALRTHFRYVPAYHLNAACAPLLSGAAGSGPETRTNHILDLNRPYETIRAGYSHGRKQELKHREALSTTIADTDRVEPLFALFLAYNTAGIGPIAPHAGATLLRLTDALRERGLLRVRVALREGRVEAGCLLIPDENRVVHLFCAASPAGRQSNVRTVILDGLIREYAGRPLVFDFESPEAAGPAAYNRSFGALPERYARIRHNHLPGPVRWANALRRSLFR